MTSPHFIIGTSVWSILDADLRKHDYDFNRNDKNKTKIQKRS